MTPYLFFWYILAAVLALGFGAMLAGVLYIVWQAVLGWITRSDAGGAAADGDNL